MKNCLLNFIKASIRRKAMISRKILYIASAVAIGVCAAVFVTKHMRVEFSTEG